MAYQNMNDIKTNTGGMQQGFPMHIFTQLKYSKNVCCECIASNCISEEFMSVWPENFQVKDRWIISLAKFTSDGFHGTYVIYSHSCFVQIKNVYFGNHCQRQYAQTMIYNTLFLAIGTFPVADFCEIEKKKA